MSVIEFLSEPIWQRLGLTLLHFLWQGLAIAVLFGLIIRLLRLNRGNNQYFACLLAFLVMIACPIATFLTLDIPTESLAMPTNTQVITEPIVSSWDTLGVFPVEDTGAGTSVASPETAEPVSSIPLRERVAGYLHTSLPWAISIWLVGVFVLSIRLLMGFVGVHRWRRGLEPLPDNPAQRVSLLAERLGLRGIARVFVSPCAVQAVAIGYFRPMVLLPAAMVTQMPLDMLEAVIAHELAHIRRFDLWVNLLQRVAETLLFYHPAVWWLSNRLRSERELCCDELAIRATGQRLTYASTLEHASRTEFISKQPALAVGLGRDRKPTLSRIRHILGLAPTPQTSRAWMAGLATIIFAIVLASVVAVSCSSRHTSNVPPADSIKPKDQIRTIRFPENRSSGTLYIRDASSKSWYEGWEKFEEATGYISVPAKIEVKLEVDEAAASDLSFLNELSADDLQVLSFGYRKVNIGTLAPINSLKKLKALNLQRSKFVSKDLRHLTGLTELEVLRLGDHKLTDESMRYIGKLTELQWLSLWSTGISDKGLKHLQNLSNLTFLALNNCDITDSGLSYLKNMTSLEGLQIPKTKITDKGLAKLKGFTNLKHISIGRNNITDSGLKHLQSLTTLENIWIDMNPITDDGLAYLSGMKNLKELYAGDTKITDMGLIHLKGLKNLRHLSINGIGDEGIKHLSELPALQFLQIHNARVTKASITYLMKMRSIEKILLSGDKINDDLLESLRAALPNCKIWDPQRSMDYPMPVWRKKFEAVYRLEEGQILKRIAPPFMPEREEYYKNKHSSQASAIRRPPDFFTFHWNGGLKNWGLGFTSGKRPLDSVLRSNLSIGRDEYEGPEELLQIEVPGDWIVRKDSTVQQRLRALEKILKDEIGRDIRFIRRQVKREVIVATGNFEFNSPLGTYDDRKFHFYSDKLDPDEGAGGGTADSVSKLLEVLARLTGIQVIDNTQSAKEIKLPYRHHRSSYLRKLKSNTEVKEKLALLLKNIELQANLKFNTQLRTVQKWFVVENEAADKDKKPHESVSAKTQTDVQGKGGAKAEETVLGWVVDSDGKGIAGVTMKFYRWDGKEKKTTQHQIIKTGKDGSFVIPYIEPGQDISFFNIMAPGFDTRELGSFIEKDADGTYYPGDRTIQLYRVGSIAGMVLDLDGKPLAGAPLSLSTRVHYPRLSLHTSNHLRAISDDKGQFVVDNVPPGTHLLFYPWSGVSSAEIDSGKWDKWKKPGEKYPSAPIKGVLAAKVVKVKEGRSTSNIVIDLSQSTCSVTGQVRDTRGQAVSGALVLLKWKAPSTTYNVGGVGNGVNPAITNKNGYYRRENLPPGPWYIGAQHEMVKKFNDPVPVKLIPGKTIQQNLYLSGHVQVEVRNDVKDKFEKISKQARKDLYGQMIQMNPREFADAYLAAFKTKDWNLAASMCRPGSKQARNAHMLGQMCNFNDSKIEVVYSNGDIALAITSQLKQVDGRQWQLAFTLTKQEKRWIVKDIDWLPPGKEKPEIEKFLETFPKAKPVPSKKTDVQVEGEEPVILGTTSENDVIFEAIELGDTVRVRQYLASGADIDVRKDYTAIP